MIGAGAKALRRHRVSLFIVHFTFVICHCRNCAASGDDKCKM